jgi:hypothetical protein
MRCFARQTASKSDPTCPGAVASREALRKGISSSLGAVVLVAAAAGEGFGVALLGVAAFTVAFGGLPPLRNPLLNPPKPPPEFGVLFLFAASGAILLEAGAGADDADGVFVVFRGVAESGVGAFACIEQRRDGYARRGRGG